MLYGYLLLKLRWSRLFISCFFTWRYFVCAFFFSFFFASTQATANFQTKIANKKKQNWTQAKIDDVLVFRYVSFITADQFSLFFSHSIPPSLSLSVSRCCQVTSPTIRYRIFCFLLSLSLSLFLCLSFSSRMSASLCYFAFRLQFFHWYFFVLRIITTYFRRYGRSPGHCRVSTVMRR